MGEKELIEEQEHEEEEDEEEEDLSIRKSEDSDTDSDGILIRTRRDSTIIISMKPNLEEAMDSNDDDSEIKIVNTKLDVDFEEADVGVLNSGEEVPQDRLHDEKVDEVKILPKLVE